MLWLKEKIKNNEKVSLEMVIEKNSKEFPLLLKLKETEQDPEWHSEGDVHIHTNMVIDEMYKIFESENLTLSVQYVLLMSAIFHDIAKPIVSKWRTVRGKEHLTARGHEYEGMSYLTYRFMEMKNEMTDLERNQILDLVGYHQRPKLLVVRDEGKWDYKILTENTPGFLFYFLELADMRGRETVDYDEQLEYIELFKMFAKEYDCFDTVSNIDNELSCVFKETFEEKSQIALDYVIGKTKKRLFDGDLKDPLISYQKYYEHKDIHATLFLMCGISGSGKTSTVNKIKNDYAVDVVVELDELRKKHKLKSNNRSEIDGRVRQEAKELLKKAFAAKQIVIFDACNQRKDFRDIVTELAEQYFAKTILVFVETPFIQCVKNDKSRSVRTLGFDIIKKQMDVFQYPEKSEFNEVLKGFNDDKK